MKKQYSQPKTAHSAVFVGMEEIVALVEEQLSTGGGAEFYPRGTSMLPLIREGRDSVLLTSVKGPLKKFDLPLYKRQNGQYVLHRIVSVNNGRYTLVGDNQFELERGLPHSRVIAVVSHIRRGGVLISVKNPIYRLYVILLYITRPARRLVRRVRAKIMRIIKK